MDARRHETRPDPASSTSDPASSSSRPPLGDRRAGSGLLVVVSTRPQGSSAPRPPRARAPAAGPPRARVPAASAPWICALSSHRREEGGGSTRAAEPPERSSRVAPARIRPAYPPRRSSSRQEDEADPATPPLDPPPRGPSPPPRRCWGREGQSSPHGPSPRRRRLVTAGLLRASTGLPQPPPRGPAPCRHAAMAGHLAPHARPHRPPPPHRTALWGREGKRERALPVLYERRERVDRNERLPNPNCRLYTRT
jgi:hypothetical protein